MKIYVAKVILILLIVMTLMIISMPKSNATFNADAYKPTELTDEDFGKATDMTKNIFTLLRSIGLVILVVSIIFLGIKYMIGSTEERADYKKTMIPIIAGAILLFAITTIVSILYETVSKITF